MLMDQPFAALVKELFDVQKYPDSASAVARARPMRRRRWWTRRRRRRCRSGGSGSGCRCASRRRRARRPWRRRSGGAAGGVAAEAAAGAGGDAALAQLPYDVTGWTLPMQMGVEVVAVAEPVSAETRRTLHKIERVEPIPGKVEGSGSGVRFLAQFQRGVSRGERYSGRGRHGRFREDRKRGLRHRRRCHPAKERRRRQIHQRGAGSVVAGEEAAHRAL